MGSEAMSVSLWQNRFPPRAAAVLRAWWGTPQPLGNVVALLHVPGPPSAPQKVTGEPLPFLSGQPSSPSGNATPDVPHSILPQSRVTLPGHGLPAKPSPPVNFQEKDGLSQAFLPSLLLLWGLLLTPFSANTGCSQGQAARPSEHLPGQ